jgi:hypothetical protein
MFSRLAPVLNRSLPHTRIRRRDPEQFKEKRSFFVETSSFPDDFLMVGGDPEAIAESGRAYGRLATLTAEAADGLRGLDSSSWLGGAGDRFRDQATAIPARLDTAHTAAAQVAEALGTFAELLAAAQHQMAGVHADATQALQALQAARLERAQHQGLAGQDGDGYDLEGRIVGLEATLDTHLAAAAEIRMRVQEAAEVAANQVRAAGGSLPVPAAPAGSAPSVFATRR